MIWLSSFLADRFLHYNKLEDLFSQINPNQYVWTTTTISGAETRYTIPQTLSLMDLTRPGVLSGIGNTLGNTLSGVTNTVGNTAGAVGKGELLL